MEEEPRFQFDTALSFFDPPPLLLPLEADECKTWNDAFRWALCGALWSSSRSFIEIETLLLPHFQAWMNMCQPSLSEFWFYVNTLCPVLSSVSPTQRHSPLSLRRLLYPNLILPATPRSTHVYLRRKKEGKTVRIPLPLETGSFLWTWD